MTTLDKKYLESQIGLEAVEDIVDRQVSLINTPWNINERNISFLKLVAPRFLGTVNDDIYSIPVESPVVTKSVLTDDIDDAVLVIPVSPDNIEILSPDMLINIDDEAMIIDSIDTAANTITVRWRWYGSSIAVAHTDTTEILLLTTIKWICEDVKNCSMPKIGCTVKNAVQRFDACTKYCNRKLQKQFKKSTDCKGTRSKMIKDYIKDAKSRAIDKLITWLDRALVNWIYWETETTWGNTAYSTMWIRAWAKWFTWDCIVNAWITYNVLAEDACQWSWATPSGNWALTYDVMTRFYKKAWENFNPNWSHAIMSWSSYNKLNEVAMTSSKCCSTDWWDKSLSHDTISKISTPYGDVTPVLNNNMPDWEIIFFNIQNIGWWASLDEDGTLYTSKEVYIDFEEKVKKWFIEWEIALDASQNMTTDLATLQFVPSAVEV